MPHAAFARMLRVGPVLAVAALAAFLAGKAGAQPQDGLDDRIETAAAGTDGDDVRDALSREIARLRADIAGIERLMRWQADLARIARTDRAEALRQRLPMSDCRASALAPLCDELTGLFRPDETGTDASGANPASEGEGAP